MTSRGSPFAVAGLFLLLSLMGLFSPVSVVSGATTTWSTNQSIVSHYTVAVGDDLIIDPGVTVTFAPNVGITVLGNLEIRGTPGNAVVLQSSSGTWDGIDVRNGATATMDNVTFTDATYISRQAAVYVNNATADLNNVTIEGNLALAGLYVQGNTGTLSASDITFHGTDFLVWADHSGTATGARLVADSVDNANALVSWRGSSSVTLSEVDVTGFNWSGNNIVYVGNTASLDLSDSSINGTASGHIIYSEGSVTLANTTLESVGTGVSLYSAINAASNSDVVADNLTANMTNGRLLRAWSNTVVDLTSVTSSTTGYNSIWAEGVLDLHWSDMTTNDGGIVIAVGGSGVVENTTVTAGDGNAISSYDFLTIANSTVTNAPSVNFPTLYSSGTHTVTSRDNHFSGIDGGTYFGRAYVGGVGFDSLRDTFSGPYALLQMDSGSTTMRDASVTHSQDYYAMFVDGGTLDLDDSVIDAASWLWVEQNAVARVDNNTFTANGPTATTSVYSKDSALLEFQNNTVYHNLSDPAANSIIYVQGSTPAVVRDNFIHTIDSVAIGLWDHTGIRTQVAHQVHDNTIDRAEVGIYAAVGGSSITGNTISSVGGTGVGLFFDDDVGITSGFNWIEAERFGIRVRNGDQITSSNDTVNSSEVAFQVSGSNNLRFNGLIANGSERAVNVSGGTFNELVSSQVRGNNEHFHLANNARLRVMQSATLVEAGRIFFDDSASQLTIGQAVSVEVLDPGGLTPVDGALVQATSSSSTVTLGTTDLFGRVDSALDHFVYQDLNGNGFLDGAGESRWLDWQLSASRNGHSNSTPYDVNVSGYHTILLWTPIQTNLSISDTSVDFLDSVTVWANATDLYWPEDQLTWTLEIDVGDGSGFQPLTGATYVGTDPTGHWEATFTADAGWPVGTHTIRSGFNNGLSHQSPLETLSLSVGLEAPQITLTTVTPSTASRATSVMIRLEASDADSALSTIVPTLERSPTGTNQWSSFGDSTILNGNGWDIRADLTANEILGIYDLRFRLTDPDLLTTELVSTGALTIVTGDPTISSFTGPTTVEAGRVVDFVILATDVEDLQYQLTLEFRYMPPAGSWTNLTPDSLVYNITTNMWDMQWMTSGTMSTGTYQIQVRATDLENGTGNWFSYAGDLVLVDLRPEVVGLGTDLAQVGHGDTVTISITALDLQTGAGQLTCEMEVGADNLSLVPTFNSGAQVWEATIMGNQLRAGDQSVRARCSDAGGFGNYLTIPDLFLVIDFAPEVTAITASDSFIRPNETIRFILTVTDEDVPRLSCELSVQGDTGSWVDLNPVYDSTGLWTAIGWGYQFEAGNQTVRARCTDFSGPGLYLTIPILFEVEGPPEDPEENQTEEEIDDKEGGSGFWLLDYLNPNVLLSITLLLFLLVVIILVAFVGGKKKRAAGPPGDQIMMGPMMDGPTMDGPMDGLLRDGFEKEEDDSLWNEPDLLFK